MFRESKKIKNSLVIETLAFLNQKIDKIVGKSELINELLEEVEDPYIIELLNKKLDLLDKEITHIGNKIDVEQKMLKGYKEQ